MKDTEINNVRFLLGVIEDADILTEDDFDKLSNDEIEDEKIDEVMKKLFGKDSAIFAAASISIRYKGELDQKDGDDKDLEDWSIGKRVWTASQNSAKWLRDNCSNSRLSEIHQAIGKVAYADKILKGKEAELLNELDKIWGLDTKEYNKDTGSGKQLEEMTDEEALDIWTDEMPTNGHHGYFMLMCVAGIDGECAGEEMRQIQLFAGSIQLQAMLAGVKGSHTYELEVLDEAIEFYNSTIKNETTNDEFCRRAYGLPHGVSVSGTPLDKRVLKLFYDQMREVAAVDGVIDEGEQILIDVAKEAWGL